METQDRKMKEKCRNYDLMEMRLFRSRFASASVEDFRGARTVRYDKLDQIGGIVRMMRNSFSSDEAFRAVQERHNANHALYYFSLITEEIIRGRSTGNDLEKVRRIRAHLVNLLEHLGADKENLRTVINTLIDELDEFGTRYHNHFSWWIYINWIHIRIFASAYGHQETCFSHRQYRKLSDVVFGNCYLHYWWWRIHSERLLAAFRWSVEKVRP